MMYAIGVILLTWAAVSGWLLSLLGCLNVPGYVIAGLPLLGWGLWACRSAGTRLDWRRRGDRLRCIARRRLSHLLPALYLVSVGVVITGGILYAPNNYDFLAYRFARMLHWWDAGGWHWIHTVNARQNMSGTGMEWALMPLLVLTGSSRLFFLLNVAAYVLLPGLVFSVFTQLGVGRRTSWFWMWIVPLGFCYVATAGGLGNDALGAVLGLLALHFAGRALRHDRVHCLWLSLLSAGLMTGIKASNLPLLLPVAVALIPVWRLLRVHWAKTAAVACVALAVSFAPMAVLNHVHTGDWAGDPANAQKLKATDAGVALLGNGLQLAAGCLAPPFFPWASAWNAHVHEWLPAGVRQRLAEDFPKFTLKLGELGNEEHVGLGLGITILLVSSLIVAGVYRDPRARRDCRWGVLLSGLLAFGAYGALMVSESTARLLIPYYPLGVASILAVTGGGQATRLRGWRGLAVLMSVMAVLMAAMSPSRPLWPVRTVMNALPPGLRDHRIVTRMDAVYSTYRERADVLAPARELLPPATRVVGFVQSGDDPEIALWRPFGQRAVRELVGPEMRDRTRLEAAKIEAIVARCSVVEQHCGSISNWLAAIDGELLGVLPLTLKVSEGRQPWCVVKLRPSEDPPRGSDPGGKIGNP